jgi:pyridoxamine 5'-phosphate oxidase
MIHKELENIRRNYKLKSLDTKDVDLNPFAQFNIWFEEMLKSNLIEPTAVILATASKQGKPSARTLLLKSYDETGFVFYSNYESKKGNELAENNNASLLFYWPELERQIRIEGKVEKVTQKESEKYFKTRPFKSKVGAWASNQSTIINSRLTIVKKFLYYLAKFHSKDIPLPPYWGGYRLVPEYFEFWQGRANRLHDRVIYQKTNDSWKIDRLSP